METLDPGIAGAATTFALVAVLLVAGWLLDRRLTRRRVRLDRLAMREAWRNDWLVGSELAIDRPAVLGFDFGESRGLTMIAMTRDEHRVWHLAEAPV